MELNDPMNMYTSKPRGFGKVIKETDLKAKKDRSEWSQQLEFCKWLKNTYPDILFRSDIQSGRKLSPQMQNIKQILDPCNGWPDIMIYTPQYGLGALEYIGLCIEMKAEKANLSGEHYRNQVAMHDRLRKLGWCVYVAKGAELAKEIFLNYCGINKN